MIIGHKTLIEMISPQITQFIPSIKKSIDDLNPEPEFYKLAWGQIKMQKRNTNVICLLLLLLHYFYLVIIIIIIT